MTVTSPDELGFIPRKIFDLIPPEVRQTITERVAAARVRIAVAREFESFPVPIHREDTPLVQHAGYDYICTGCGGRVPDGVRIYENVKNGMVIGMRMEGGPDGRFRHQCGEVVIHG
jgi:hypothetical protein